MEFELELELIVGLSNLIIALIMTVLSIISAKKLKGSPLFWCSVFFIVVSAFYSLHSLIEIFEISELLYAVSSLFGTLLLLFVVIISDITVNMMGVKK